MKIILIPAKPNPDPNGWAKELGKKWVDGVNGEEF